MHSLKRAVLALSLSLLALGCADAELDAATEASAQVLAPATRALDLPITLRGGTASATIRVTVFEIRRFGKTALAVHGLAETGATFAPLASALAADIVQNVGRLVALDMVGHGGSSLPSGIVFGELTIDDNVGVVISVIEALRARGLAPDMIIGHSMGGLAVQAAQERLLASGSSLAKLGIRGAVLLAPVPPHGRPWDQPAGAADIAGLIQQDAELGGYLELPPEAFVAQAFTTTKGVLAPHAPTPAEVVARGYTGREPVTTLLQLIEAPVPLPDGSTVQLARPSVREGAFSPANGTRVRVFAFEEDTLVPAANVRDLARYLAGPGYGNLTVTGDDAVHSGYISDPQGVLGPYRVFGL